MGLVLYRAHRERHAAQALPTSGHNLKLKRRNIHTVFTHTRIHAKTQTHLTILSTHLAMVAMCHISHSAWISCDPISDPIAPQTRKCRASVSNPEIHVLLRKTPPPRREK